MDHQVDYTVIHRVDDIKNDHVEYTVNHHVDYIAKVCRKLSLLWWLPSH